MKITIRRFGMIAISIALAITAACTRAPLFIKDLDEREIQRVSDEDLCRASDTFLQTRGRTYPNVEAEIARRGLNCGASAQAQLSTQTVAGPAEPAEPAQTTARALRNVNMRSGPGTNHSVVGLLPAGDRDCHARDWRLVRMHGEGWAHRLH